ncbi:DNA-directed RNA polymerase subunit alpha [Demequina litorisediminis]|uniref:DNA-directed RNA polymerase subunit alpha n=1 Tax=Demequina litorisediminis TaxID=1849022 RepID=A0ABQ6IGG9_9MICO|nr:DNA-directed RNA polymerase subunit alpha [Demequina litorisediminis]
MLIAQRPTLTETVISDNRSQFSLKPLEPGFGYTLGNSLRRTLLSSIPGAAVTSVRFEGVLHEFSTIEGVKEDVTEILLNLKNLVVSSEHDEPVVMYLRKSGAGAVTAADIAPPAGVEIHNPDLHIATLNAKARFEVEPDRRARPWLRARLDEQEPTTRRSVRSPSTRSTRRCSRSPTRSRRPVWLSAPTLTSLIIDVETKNSISARDALASAGSTLVELFSLARGLNEAAEGIEIGPSDTDESLEEDYNQPIEEPEPHAAFVQLPQARGHPHRGRADRPLGGGPDGHPQLRAEVDHRGQGEARGAWASRSRTAASSTAARPRACTSRAATSN